MDLRFLPLADGHAPLVEKWLEDPDSKRRVGGLLPFRAFLDYQQANPDYHVWIASDGNATIGLAGFEKYGDGSASLVVLVSPDARGRGYGRNILTDLRGKAALASVNALVAFVEPDNGLCISCLRAAGFVNRGVDSEDEEFFRFVCDLQPAVPEKRAEPRR